MENHSRATVLAVDDEPSNINVIAGYLKSLNIRLMVANSGEKALTLVKKDAPDVILLDIRMPGISGLEVCRALKDDPQTRQIPVIFLTASESDISEAFEIGGVDYIIKPVREEELQARVKTHLELNKLMQSLANANALLEGTNETLEAKVQERTRELVTANRNLRREVDERRRLQDKISYLSEHDFVTRMLNRAAMETELEKALDVDVNERDNHTYLLFFDLDQFKVINDTCGHIAGDELLRQIAETLRGITSRQDVCARMGGDEFAILFNAKDMGFALEKTKRIKQTIESLAFVWDDETFLHNVSLALVEVDESIDSVSHLLSIAERTCYYSKIKGGGEISVFNASRDLIEKSQQQSRQVPIIRQAISDNKLALNAQRIIPVQPNLPEKAEVLVRMIDPEGKLRPPGLFIPIAERYHLIDSIDRWVITHTCAFLQAHPGTCQLGVNLSGDFIAKQDATDFIRDTLAKHDLKGEQLCFEITETSAIANIDATIHLIESASKLRCEFALDDFGTGTSSYEYLKKLDVHYVKIDGLFVRDIERDTINRKMVESITAIARAKQIMVVAECVETQEAKAILQGIGVDYIQGYCEHIPEPINTALASAPTAQVQ